MTRLCWEIVPYVSIGPIGLNMTRGMVRDEVHEQVASFHKGHDERPLVDAFDAIGVHVYYDPQDTVEFVEVFQPCDPEFNEVRFIGRKYLEVVHDLAIRGICYEPHESGVRFDSIGIALYVEVGEVIALSLYRRGYYDLE